MKLFTNNYEITCFDNEGDAEAAAAAAKAEAEAEAAKAAAGDPPAGDKLFTQEQVNKMMGVRTKALKEKYGVLEQTYTGLLEQTNLTEAAREKLEGDLEAVQAQMRTKEQQIEFEQKKAQTKFDSELGKANERGEKYQGLFESSVSKRAITDAAMANDGCNADDFIAHLEPRTQVVIELDAEGQKTGNLVPMVDWEIADKETGAVTKVSKSPDEVVKLMQEMPKYGNLFKSNIATGVGGGTAQASPSTSGKIDHRTLSTADYMELSKTVDGRRALGLKN